VRDTADFFGKDTNNPSQTFCWSRNVFFFFFFLRSSHYRHCVSLVVRSSIRVLKRDHLNFARSPDLKSRTTDRHSYTVACETRWKRPKTVRRTEEWSTRRRDGRLTVGDASVRKIWSIGNVVPDEWDACLSLRTAERNASSSTADTVGKTSLQKHGPENRAEGEAKRRRRATLDRATQCGQSFVIAYGRIDDEVKERGRVKTARSLGRCEQKQNKSKTNASVEVCRSRFRSGVRTFTGTPSSRCRPRTVRPAATWTPCRCRTRTAGTRWAACRRRRVSAYRRPPSGRPRFADRRTTTRTTCRPFSALWRTPWPRLSVSVSRKTHGQRSNTARGMVETDRPTDRQHRTTHAFRRQNIHFPRGRVPLLSRPSPRLPLDPISPASCWTLFTSRFVCES